MLNIACSTRGREVHNTVLVEIHEGKKPLITSERIILKWNLQKIYEMLWPCIIWLRTGTSGRLL